jgi:hypothetical protein
MKNAWELRTGVYIRTFAGEGHKLDDSNNGPEKTKTGESTHRQ